MSELRAAANGAHRYCIRHHRNCRRRRRTNRRGIYRVIRFADCRIAPRGIFRCSHQCRRGCVRRGNGIYRSPVFSPPVIAARCKARVHRRRGKSSAAPRFMPCFRRAGAYFPSGKNGAFARSLYALKKRGCAAAAAEFSQANSRRSQGGKSSRGGRNCRRQFPLQQGGVQQGEKCLPARRQNSSRGIRAAFFRPCSRAFRAAFTSAAICRGGRSAMPCKTSGGGVCISARQKSRCIRGK